MLRSNFKTGDVIISGSTPPLKAIRGARRSTTIGSRVKPIVAKERAPSFKATEPGPRTFLGINEFRAKELKEKGLKIDLGTVKVREPVLDDRGNPINDAAGQPVTRERNVEMKNIGITVQDKIDRLEELLSESKQEIINNRVAIIANLAGLAAAPGLAAVPAGAPMLHAGLRVMGVVDPSMTFAQQSSALNRIGAIHDGRFFSAVGARGDVGVNSRGIGLSMNKFAQELDDQKALGVDDSKIPVKLDAAHPVIGSRGKRIESASVIRSLSRGGVIDTQHRDSTGALAPRMFRDLREARASLRAEGAPSPPRPLELMGDPGALEFGL